MSNYDTYFLNNNLSHVVVHKKATHISNNNLIHVVSLLDRTSRCVANRGAPLWGAPRVSDALPNKNYSKI
jgi:hypothetical protein